MRISDWSSDVCSSDLFRPLFLTGWLIADQFEDEGDYGAAQILIASASSKTAIGLGFTLKQRPEPRPDTVGLTSTAHVDALAAQGIYDRVSSYDQIMTPLGRESCRERRC